MKNNKQPSLVTILIMTTITVTLWVGYSIYISLTKDSPISIPESSLTPIKVELDVSILDEIANNKYYERGETPAFAGEYETVTIVSGIGDPENISNPENEAESIETEEPEDGNQETDSEDLDGALDSQDFSEVENEEI
jgi:hypothetical protein